tara:strand:+ start:633 stop:998 length:366 start_codon:yes stop_codon:yes gene_type:complete
MRKIKPNIITPFNDRKRIKDLVHEVISDTFVTPHIPDTVTLTGGLLTLTLTNKKFVFQDIAVDDLSDYIDTYLQGLKLEGDVYTVRDNGSDIIINFTESVGLDQSLYDTDDFEVKGKIVSR